MRLVEAVARERLHQVEDVARRAAARHAARDRAIRRTRQRCSAISSGFFLPIARRSEVGAAERVAREDLRDLHDLLLVQDHAVGRLAGSLRGRGCR